MLMADDNRCSISGMTAGGRHVLRYVAEAGTEVCGMPDERHPSRESWLPGPSCVK